MNSPLDEFLGQFLIESRELIAQATDGLLVLERSPQDPERLDAVFRAVHTLKGGAGIVDFAAMERAVHAAENVLSDVRSGKRNLTTALVGDCLSCLDQVEQWLEGIERTGELPATADAQAENVVNRFRISAGAPQEPRRAGQGWIADSLKRNPTLRGRVTTALQFIPDPDCFFQGEDPIARMTSLPQLLALDVEPLSAWPALSALDPFKCNLVLTALTASTLDAVTAHMNGHTGTCDMQVVAAEAVPDEGEFSLPLRARDVLKEQLMLLEQARPENFVGHVGSAGQTATNVLRFHGRIGHAELLGLATDRSLKDRNVETLREAITQAIASDEPVARDIAKPHSAQDAATRTLRVDANRIDALVRLTGELTVAKNAIGHVLRLAQAEGNSITSILKERHGVLEHLVGELQRSVLGMRVLPLRSVFQRFPRVLRDMSSALGKPVNLTMEGDETEADKAIVEMLFEPLLHVLRNALDHGIENQATRASLGKPPTGALTIRAARRADQVLIEISDDGGGIDVARVREVATRRGVIADDVLRTMTDEEVVDLIFAPGFSTAATVTELSGRGVGMDAVRTAVERVGGRVTLESRKAQGTTVRFSLPFSVMMTRVMTVEAGGQMFGIPLDAVVETVRVPSRNINQVGAAQAIVLRNRTLPVVELGSVLGAVAAPAAESDATIIVASFAGQLVAVRVDRIGERLEVILKPLEGLLNGIPGITGTTVLGDGRVLLVLDIGELLQ